MAFTGMIVHYLYKLLRDDKPLNLVFENAQKPVIDPVC